MWPGSSIPATTCTAEATVAPGLCRPQADRFLVPSASLKSCCPKKSHQENLNSSASPRRTKTWRVLAAVSALTDRNTFVRSQRRERRRCNNTKTKNTKGKNIYETHTNPALNASLSDAGGVFYDRCSHAAGRYARPGAAQCGSIALVHGCRRAPRVL